jgi:hypothetical protein
MKLLVNTGNELEVFKFCFFLHFLFVCLFYSNKGFLGRKEAIMQFISNFGQVIFPMWIRYQEY